MCPLRKEEQYRDLVQDTATAAVLRVRGVPIKTVGFFGSAVGGVGSVAHVLCGDSRGSEGDTAASRAAVAGRAAGRGAVVVDLLGLLCYTGGVEGK